jgi:hypothetical protein
VTASCQEVTSTTLHPDTYHRGDPTGAFYAAAQTRLNPHNPPARLSDGETDAKTGPASVLLIESRPQLRAAIVETCREAGIPVFAAGSIVDVERWPAGDIVITDLEHLTPWWHTVGAQHVIALADDPDPDAMPARLDGATGWLRRSDSPRTVVALVRRLASASSPRRTES